MPAPSQPPGFDQWFRCVVERYERPLTLYAHRITGDLERARDVVQDTFLRLCDQGPLAQEQVGSHLAQWLYTVCRNAAINVRRKERRILPMSDEQSVAEVDLEQNPAHRTEQSESQQLALQALASLPPKQQEVLRLKFQHELSYRQISAVTGLTTSYVGYLMHAGLKEIRRRMDQSPAAIPAAPGSTAATSVQEAQRSEKD